MNACQIRQYPLLLLLAKLFEKTKMNKNSNYQKAKAMLYLPHILNLVIIQLDFVLLYIL